MKCAPEGSVRSSEGPRLISCGSPVEGVGSHSETGQALISGAVDGALSPSRSRSAATPVSADAIGAVADGTAAIPSTHGPSATAGDCGVGPTCSSSTSTRPANGAGRSAVSQITAGDTFRKVNACDQPASLVTTAFQIALPSGVGCTMP